MIQLARPAPCEIARWPTIRDRFCTTCGCWMLLWLAPCGQILGTQRPGDQVEGPARATKRVPGGRHFWVKPLLSLVHRNKRSVLPRLGQPAEYQFTHLPAVRCASRTFFPPAPKLGSNPNVAAGQSAPAISLSGFGRTAATRPAGLRFRNPAPAASNINGPAEAPSKVA